MKIGENGEQEGMQARRAALRLLALQPAGPGGLSLAKWWRRRSASGCANSSAAQSSGTSWMVSLRVLQGSA